MIRIKGIIVADSWNTYALYRYMEHRVPLIRRTTPAEEFRDHFTGLRGFECYNCRSQSG